MPEKKQYIIRKYILARSAAEALKIERDFKADEVWLDNEWKGQQEEPEGQKQLGFKTNARRQTP